MSFSSSPSLLTSCDTTFISSDSSTLSNDGPSHQERSQKDTSLSSQIFTTRRKARACSVPHILPSINDSEARPASPHLTDVILHETHNANPSKNSMSSSFRDIRRFDGSTLANNFSRPNRTTFGVKQKFRRSSYSLTCALEDPITDDGNGYFPPRSSSIKKLFQAPSPRINQLKQEEGMERETTHERSTHINLLLSNTWEDLALDGFTDKEKNCGTKNSKDSPMSDHAIDPIDSNDNYNYRTDISGLKNDSMNGKSLLSPNSNNTKTNSPYIPFRAISSPTGKCYASRRSLSPVIILKPSSISIKRKYDSDNDSCASSPPIKKHQSYSLTTEQCMPNLGSVFNCNLGRNPYDNRSLPPSPARLFDFAQGTSRSSSPCYSEESNRAYENKMHELDCIVSAGNDNGNALPKCYPNPGFSINCPISLQKRSYKGPKVPLRPGLSLSNIDCQENKSFNHCTHSLRAKSLISPLSFRCFPPRGDMMGSPLPSLWSSTLTKSTTPTTTPNDGYDDECLAVDDAVLCNSYEDGTPESIEGPFEVSQHYVPSPRSCGSPLASPAMAFKTSSCHQFGILSPTAYSSYSQSLHNSTSTHDKDVFCDVPSFTATNTVLTCFVPIDSNVSTENSPRPQSCEAQLQQCVTSPPESSIDVGSIEATVNSNVANVFLKKHPDQMDIDGKDPSFSNSVLTFNSNGSTWTPLPTTPTPERMPVISVPLTSR